MTPPADHIRRFLDACRADHHLVSTAARAAGLDLWQAAEVWAWGAKTGRIRLRDDGPGGRWLEVME